MSFETAQTSCEDELPKLMNQLSVARSELQNLRRDLKKLNHCYRKDIDSVITSLKSWKCESCTPFTSKTTNDAIESELVENENENDWLLLQPIGYVSSSFVEKRGTPRQPGICIDSCAKVTLSNNVFTNPDHALEGLEQFSHMWILFHFHKNDSKHVRAKVAPPRLNGLKTGVFGTRSPHRPSPIGLSLVRINRVEGCSVHFSGVDMLDGTPVLDIKPYIPQYDSPFNLERVGNAATLSANGVRLCDEAIPPPSDCDCVHMPREAPDGQECIGSDAITQVSSLIGRTPEQIRVPQWISEPINSLLKVTYQEKARLYLDSLKDTETDSDSTNSNIENTITRILEEDPRSVYVRERYSNQFYTFLIHHHHVSCKFDDFNHIVQVYKITKASPLSQWRDSFDDSERDN